MPFVTAMALQFLPPRRHHQQEETSKKFTAQENPKTPKPQNPRCSRHIEICRHLWRVYKVLYMYSWKKWETRFKNSFLIKGIKNLISQLWSIGLNLLNIKTYANLYKNAYALVIKTTLICWNWFYKIFKSLSFKS